MHTNLRFAGLLNAIAQRLSAEGIMAGQKLYEHMRIIWQKSSFIVCMEIMQQTFHHDGAAFSNRIFSSVFPSEDNSVPAPRIH